MKRFNKGLSALVLGVTLSLGTTITALAVTDAYLIKDKSTGIVYEYDKTTLNNAAVNYTISGSDPYYEEFDGKKNKYAIYAFHSSSGKYVEFSVASSALINYTLEGKEFNLDTFIDLSSTPSLNITAPIKSVQLENGQVKYVDKSKGQTPVDEEEGDLEVISIE